MPHDPRSRAAAARSLQPCRSCARIADVSGIAIGERVRCACGAVFQVEPPAPISVRPLTCGRCGGAFQSGAPACPYCDAEIALEDRQLSGVCASCFARLGTDARFCPGCGCRIASQALRAMHADAKCPRCAGELRARAVSSIEVVECSSCAGLWLAPQLLESLCAKAEEGALVRRALDAAPPPIATVSEARVTYLPCVVCRDPMTRRNFGGSSGVVIDVCKDHGVWLDHAELGRVLDFVRGGGLELARARALERERRERETKALAPRASVPPSVFETRDDDDGLFVAVLDALAHFAGFFATRVRR